MALFKNRRSANLRPSYDAAHNEGVQNAADTLLANIRFSEVDKPLKIICVTSAAPNDGKTTTAMALAIAAARIGCRALIVEGDMRRRSLRRALDVRARFGIHAVITGKASIQEAVVPTKDEGVFFLDAEQGIPNPESVLHSQRFKALLEELAQVYDYVIVDTPPVAAFADACIVASVADGTILVVRENDTEKRDAVYAVDSLRKADANILGACINCEDDRHAGGYYYGYYRSYYEKPEADEEAPTIQS